MRPLLRNKPSRVRLPWRVVLLTAFNLCSLRWGFCCSGGSYAPSPRWLRVGSGVWGLGSDHKKTLRMLRSREAGESAGQTPALSLTGQEVPPR